MHFLAVKEMDPSGNTTWHSAYANELWVNDSASHNEFCALLDMDKFYEGIFRWRTNKQLKALFSLIQWEKRPEPREIVTPEEARLLQYCSDARNLQKLLIANSIETVEKYNHEEYNQYGEDAEGNSVNIQVFDNQKRIVLIDYQFEGWQDCVFAGDKMYIFNLVDDTFEIASRRLFNKKGKDNMVKKVIKR